MQKVCIIDIDNTLADCSHRLHHIQKEPKDWDSFFAECNKDTVIEHVRDMVRGFAERKYQLFFFTARPEKTRLATEGWLWFNLLVDKSFPATTVFLSMRQDNDHRDDDILKKEMLDTHFPDRSVIHMVLEDRPRIIRMYRAEGLKVLDCGDGVEF